MCLIPVIIEFQQLSGSMSHSMDIIILYSVRADQLYFTFGSRDIDQRM